jgi:exopolyphosphatase/guanosine-5'-triphosphate,3'-diphosphate pyrophosphatase
MTFPSCAPSVPQSEALSRLSVKHRRSGVIDIGSNSVRFVVFDGPVRAPSVMFNEKSLCGLGADLATTGRLSEKGEALALSAIRRFCALSIHMAIDPLTVIATAAVRDAMNGPAFSRRIQEEFGVTVRVVSGDDEALLAAQGVLFGDPRAHGVAMDMGGASLEFAEITMSGEIGARVSTELGPLRLLKRKALDRQSAIHSELARLDADSQLAQAAYQAPNLYALGGAWRAIARAHMLKNKHPLMILQGYRLSYEEALSAARWVASLSPEALSSESGVSERRAAVTPLAAAIQVAVLKKFRPKSLVISAFGLREGVLWGSMSREERRQDPLIVAANDIGMRRGRDPAFGDMLWRWLRPSISLTDDEARLAHAVCLLSDATWRGNPDYRAQGGFELATRSNLAGASHADRAFIGWALLHRHKGGGREIKKYQNIRALLSERGRLVAEAVGRGARLGVAVSGGVAVALNDYPLRRRGDVLRLDTGEAVAEMIDKRFNAYAAALQAVPKLGTAKKLRF